jgi:methionine-rich copper-binding protein CopC
MSLAFLTLVSAPSQAHTQLVSSSPSNGAVLDVAPTAVTYVFNEPLLPHLDTVSINTESGVNVTSKSVKPNKNTLSMPWPIDLMPGKYQVAYRIVADDGHPVTGSITLSYGTPVAPSASLSATGVTSDDVVVEDSAPVGTMITVIALIAAVLSISLIVVLVKRGKDNSSR